MVKDFTVLLCDTIRFENWDNESILNGIKLGADTGRCISDIIAKSAKDGSLHQHHSSAVSTAYAMREFLALKKSGGG